MSRITLKEAAQWCGGSVEPKYEAVTFQGASNDSRNVEPGQLFVALQGARDGHAFVPTALEAGAAAVLCTHRDGDYPAIVVEDTRLALGHIARGVRQQLGMRVVGITGSVGKSTTKEMVAAILAKKYRVGKSPANHNNDIGLPMAVLALPEDTEVAVLEMGMNHFREMAYLSAIAMPDIAVITNIGTMHIENLGSREGILQAKLEILEGLREGGRLVYNGDEPLLLGQKDRSPCAPVYFGRQPETCQVRCEALKTWHGHTTFTAHGTKGSFPVTMAVEGEHFAVDALAAIAVGELLEVPASCMREALAEYKNMAGRQEEMTANGCRIIKDCYNAGPESMAAALEVLSKRSGRRVAVLGDMLELGDHAGIEHDRVGRMAAKCCDMVLALGDNAQKVVNGARTGGMGPQQATACRDQEEMAGLLRCLVRPGDTLLFKGSHGMHMEQVLELFLKEK